MTQPTSPAASRRDFLTATAVAGATLAGLAPSVHAAGTETLRIGLIGCGGRGRGAAINALRADPNVKLVAMGDTFKDQWQDALVELGKADDVQKKIDVKPERCFDGFDNYKKVLESGVDVVLLCTPPGFRPLHLQAAVAAGKHVFCEKPMAVDAPGVKKVLDASREAKKKGLAVVSGFCFRYEKAKRELMKRVHDGQVGDIIALHCTYNTNALWHKERKPGMTDMEWQVRNWPYFTWLSGDHIVEQAVHSIDKMAWAMKDEPPVSAVGLGGRQTRTDKKFGHIFDHHAVVFEYKSGVKMFHYCRQQIGTAKKTSDFVMGSQGTADVMGHAITGKKPWKLKRADRGKDNMYQNEHDELFASIRAGKPINDGEFMARSTMLAILGRMATYTGQLITWDKAMASKEDLTPAKYEWGKMPVPPVAMPGYTEFE